MTETQGNSSGDSELLAVISFCRAAHERLFGSLEGLTDDTARRPSELPGWTVGHVLTHIARNAESHVRMLQAAVEGHTVEQYAGGYEQRTADIEAGSSRSAPVLVEDVRVTARALEDTWEGIPPEAWSGHGLARGRLWPCRDLPFHRWREVEIHHADLGQAYSAADWPEEYVSRELPGAVATIPIRLPDQAARRRLLAWLFGRAREPGELLLAEWQSRPELYFTRDEEHR